MRSACANHYRDPQEILQYAIGASATNPRVDLEDVPQLAMYMRNSVNELSQLSGVSRPVARQGSEWRIIGEWLSKSNFVKLRHAPICPHCLAEATFLAGEWHLAFSTACWKHDCQLVERCPQCLGQLALARRCPEYCECGFDLRQSVATAAAPQEVMVARIMANRAYGPLNLDLGVIPASQIENLARRSLDGLCHTLWFFGHHLLGNFPLTQGNGCRKLSIQEVRAITAGACWLLSDWPNTLYQALSRQISTSSKWCGGNAAIRLLGPIQRYYDAHIEAGDFRFISVPYEAFIRQLVKRSGVKARRSRLDSPQLELDLR